MSRDIFTTFETMCEAVGSDATERQVLRLADYVRDNFGMDYFRYACNISLRYDIPGLYTQLSMLVGECGA